MKKIIKLLLAVLMTMTLTACGSSNEETTTGTFESISWPSSGLAALLPEPSSDDGELVGYINRDNDVLLSIDIGNITEDDYLSYVDACTEKGFNIDSQTDTDRYEAYDETGNELILCYYENSDYYGEDYYNIRLDVSKVTGTFTWPTEGLATLLPEPESNIGTIDIDNSNFFTVYVGESSDEDISKYIDTCIKAGFDVDYSKDNTSFEAENEYGISIYIEDVGFDIMCVELSGYDDEVEAALGNSTDNSEYEKSSDETDDSSKTNTNSEEEILNTSNCEEFAELLTLKDEFDSSIGSFAEKYKGRQIEFDANVVSVTNHDDYTTRFDFLILSGDYSETSVSGPYFQFEDKNYYDLNLVGDDVPDSLEVGMNIHVIATVKKYDSNTGLFKLDPVEISIR
ncbi:MAG: DUF4839 domain-containing protein [Erysipelotrichaceae bacterium]|nr:DUF4839 domain-containing protein [Erysipelotrichaceae bacterium]